MVMKNELDRFSVRNFLYIVFKNKWQILLFLFISVAAATIVTLKMKPMYNASSQILIKSVRDDFYIPASGKTVMAPNREEEINSELELLMGRSLMEQLIDTMDPVELLPGLKINGREVTDLKSLPKAERQIVLDEAIQKIEKNLNVQWVKKSNIIDLSFRHPNPEIAAKALNQYVNLYLDRHLQVHKNPESMIFFQEQAELFKKRIEDAERKLRLYKEEKGITSVEETLSSMLRQEADLQFELNNANREAVELENRLKEVKVQIAKTPMNIRQGEEVGAPSDIVDALEARLVELELKEKDLLLKYKPESRSVSSVRDEIRIVRDKMNSLKEKSSGRSTYGINTTYQELQKDQYRWEADLKAISGKKEMLEKQLVSYHEKISALNDIQVQIIRLQDQIKEDQGSYRMYQTKYEETRISDAMTTQKIANVSLIEPARVPIKPVSPNKKLNLLMSLLMGLVGGFGIAFLRDYIDDSIEKPEDVERLLDLPFLGSIGVIRPGAIPHH